MDRVTLGGYSRELLIHHEYPPWLITSHVRGNNLVIGIIVSYSEKLEPSVLLDIIEEDEYVCLFGGV